jgi:hypothetical protein
MKMCRVVESRGTDREVMANRPDIIIKKRERNHVY